MFNVCSQFNFHELIQFYNLLWSAGNSLETRKSYIECNVIDKWLDSKINLNSNSKVFLCCGTECIPWQCVYFHKNKQLCRTFLQAQHEADFNETFWRKKKWKKIPLLQLLYGRFQKFAQTHVFDGNASLLSFVAASLIYQLKCCVCFVDSSVFPAGFVRRVLYLTPMHWDCKNYFKIYAECHKLMKHRK